MNALTFWIKDILENENIPYQIVGDFAAHGSRPIADIPEEFAALLLPSIQAYISKPPTGTATKDKDLVVPVIPISELVAYKPLLGREVDLIAMRELTKISASYEIKSYQFVLLVRCL